MDDENNPLKKMPADKVSISSTLNQMGYTSSYLNDYALQFIDYASHQKQPVLEIGSAFGAVSLAALKAGAKVIANDIEPAHLKIIYERAPSELRSNLILLPGPFPDVLNLPEGSLGGCFASRVLGHLSFEKLREGFEQLFTCFSTNAKLFIITGSVYTRMFRSLIPVYEKRIMKNEEWPGYFTGLKKLVKEKYRDTIPDSLNFLSEGVLRRELERVGFIVDQVNFFQRLDLPEGFRWDGREGQVVIAHKP